MVFFVLDFCFDTRFCFLVCFLAGAPALPACLGLRKTKQVGPTITRLGVSDIPNVSIGSPCTDK